MWKLLLVIMIAVRASGVDSFDKLNDEEALMGRLIHDSSFDIEDWVAGIQGSSSDEDEDEISLSEMFEQQMRDSNLLHTQMTGYLGNGNRKRVEEEMAAGKDEFAIENKAKFGFWVNADCDRQWLKNRKTSESSTISGNGGVDVLKIGVEMGGSHSKAESREEAYEYTQKTSGFTWVHREETLPFNLPSCYKNKVYVWIRYQNSRKQWLQPYNGWPAKLGTYRATGNGRFQLKQICVGHDSGCGIDGGLGLGDGDCDHDYDCKRGLVCGKDNCMSEFDHRGGHWDDADDCCTTECRKDYFKPHSYLRRHSDKYMLDFICADRDPK